MTKQAEIKALKEILKISHPNQRISKDAKIIISNILKNICEKLIETYKNTDDAVETIEIIIGDNFEESFMQYDNNRTPNNMYHIMLFLNDNNLKINGDTLTILASV